MDHPARIDLANDPLNLLAVDGPVNEQKGDADAASWLPPNKNYRCAYVARQIAVKARYQLWITRAEHDAMAAVLARCPDQRALSEAGAPATANPPPHPTTTHAPPSTKAAPPPTQAPAPDVYYPNCAAVRAAGKAPLLRGQPGYRPALDRDGDGVACES
jgi:hypothetical protein